MKISTPITKKALKDHLNYNWYKYVILIALGCMLISLIYTVTEYHSPEDKRVDIYFVSSSVSQENALNEINMILPEIPFVSEVETVECITIPIYSDGYSTEEVLLLRLGVAREVDIIFLPEDYFIQYARQGCFIPLEELVSNGTIHTEGIDLTAGYTSYIIDETIGSYETHLYGIPTDSLTGYLERFGFDCNNAFMCISAGNGNEENVLLMADALIKLGIQSVGTAE